MNFSERSTVEESDGKNGSIWNQIVQIQVQAPNVNCGSGISTSVCSSEKRNGDVPNKQLLFQWNPQSPYHSLLVFYNELHRLNSSTEEALKEGLRKQNSYVLSEQSKIKFCGVGCFPLKELQFQQPSPKVWLCLPEGNLRGQEGLMKRESESADHKVLVFSIWS